MLKSEKKAVIKQVSTDLKILIPAEKNLKFFLVSVFWFVGWYFFYRFAQNIDEVFVQIWLVLWTIAGVIFVLIFLWFLFGYEQLRISQSEIVLLISLFGLKYNRTIEKLTIKSCTFSEEQIEKRNQRKNVIFLTSPAKIKIATHYKDYFIGSSLVDSEAREIMEIINKRFN